MPKNREIAEARSHSMLITRLLDLVDLLIGNNNKNSVIWKGGYEVGHLITCLTLGCGFEPPPGFPEHLLWQGGGSVVADKPHQQLDARLPTLRAYETYTSPLCARASKTIKTKFICLEVWPSILCFAASKPSNSHTQSFRPPTPLT
jgi:hypothetical protein